MPSGRTHDIVTYLLIPPTFIAALAYWGEAMLAAVATSAMVFAGLMFGPDLDIHSQQYRRWGPFRFIWFPYKVALAHRSRLTHGLLFSTPFRLLYFLSVLLILATVMLYLRQKYLHGIETTLGAEFEGISREFALLWRDTQKNYLWAAFIGLWVGAASHTLTDLCGTVMKKIWQAF